MFVLRNRLLAVAAALTVGALLVPRPAAASNPSAISRPQFAQVAAAAPTLPAAPTAPSYVLLSVAPDGSFQVQFCRNDPVNATDPTGLVPIEEFTTPSGDHYVVKAWSDSALYNVGNGRRENYGVEVIESSKSDDIGGLREASELATRYYNSFLPPEQRERAELNDALWSGILAHYVLQDLSHLQPSAPSVASGAGGDRPSGRRGDLWAETLEQYSAYRPAGPTAAKRTLRTHPGKQGKHIPGHNNYIEGRSRVTHADPQKLVDDFAGTGQQAGNIPAGQPGFKERVDFGQVIGEFVDPATGESVRTTIGIIHHAKDGVHIVPARPGG